MKNIYKQFFAAEGRTSTSANYLANKAKECYQKLQAEIDAVNFLNKKIMVMGCEPVEVIGSITEEELMGYESKIDKIGECKTLIAWLREAIKAREAAIKDVNDMDFEEWCESREIAVPKKPEYPEKPVYLTEEDIIGQMNVKERNEYLKLEAVVANLGKYIHPDGNFNMARKNMYNGLKRKNMVEGTGHDMTITSYYNTIPVEKIDDMFLKLQEKHRNIQARLNGLKHEIELKLEEDKREKSVEYRSQLNKVTADMQIYNGEIKKLIEQFEEMKREKISFIRDLKIIIPNDLINIVKEIELAGR